MAMKPDYIDIDNDGNKTEPMKIAAAQMKKKPKKMMGGGMIKPKKMMGGGMMYRGRKYAYGGKVSKYGKD